MYTDGKHLDQEFRAMAMDNRLSVISAQHSLFHPTVQTVTNIPYNIVIPINKSSSTSQVKLSKQVTGLNE